MGSNGVGRVGIGGSRETVSEWKVCIPEGKDRAEYIKDCYLTGRVSLKNGNGEYEHGVRVGKLAMQEIDFPENIESFGSDVICLTSPYSKRLTVVDVFYNSDQYQRQEEGQFTFLKKVGLGSAAVIVDGNGNITATINGDEDNGVFTINVTNENRAGKLRINVNGDFLIENDGNYSVKSSTSIKAEFNNGTVSNVLELNENGILVNGAEEPILLGNKVADLFTAILDQLGQESAGPYPLLGNPLYLQLKEQIEGLKSTKSFVG